MKTTDGKTYYMSHSEYCFDREYLKQFSDSKIRNAMDKERFNASILVCASNKENARIAVEKHLKSEGMFSVLRCRIDDLVIGD